MTAPNSIPMTPRHFLLRVYSIKRLQPGYDNLDNRGDSKGEIEFWEVRAENAPAAKASPRVSLFYIETVSHLLPPVDSLLHVTVDNQLTDPVAPAKPE